jgi:hydrogenase maturation protease
MTQNRKNILILNVGNVLWKDEGIGYHVIERLKKMPLPADVEFVDGSVLGNKLLYHFEGRKKVIVIEMIKRGGAPGTIYRYTDEEINELQEGRDCTVPEWEFMNEVHMSRLIGTQPDEMVFICVEPEDTGENSLSCEVGLSPTLRNKVPEIIEMVMKEIEAMQS